MSDYGTTQERIARLEGQVRRLRGVLWIAAFGLFVYIYTPILTGPRVDGHTG